MNPPLIHLVIARGKTACGAPKPLRHTEEERLATCPACISESYQEKERSNQ